MCLGQVPRLNVLASEADSTALSTRWQSVPAGRLRHGVPWGPPTQPQAAPEPAGYCACNSHSDTDRAFFSEILGNRPYDTVGLASRARTNVCAPWVSCAVGV